jgi:hypothetical protein
MNAPRLVVATSVAILLPLLLLPVVSMSPQAAQPHPVPSFSPNHEQVSQALTNNPLIFIENVGQFADGARFLVHGGDRTIWLAEDAIWVTVLEPRSEGAEGQGGKGAEGHSSARFHEVAPQPDKAVHVRLSFPGANPHPRLEPFDRLDTHVSYFMGGDPAGWHADVPVWGGVRYVDLYPGIDLELAGQDRRLAPRLVVRGDEGAAQLAHVRLRVEGADALALDSDHLRLGTPLGDFTLPLFQIEGTLDANRFPPALTGDQVAWPFAVSANDAPSTIRNARSPADNPADLLYATFLGGSSMDGGHGIAMDGSGYAYVTGYTHSSNFPAAGGPGYDTSYNGSGDAFVVKLNPTGTGLAYATFLGGSSGDSGEGIAVDSSGNVYVTGTTGSSDFPAAGGPGYDNSFNGGISDAFLVKLNPNGTSLAYATFLGGSSGDSGEGIAVDDSGHVYVTGYTESSNFPAAGGPGYDTSHNGGYDAFVVKLDPAATDLAYATFLGGSSYDWGRSIAVDGSDHAYVIGETQSSNFPAVGGSGYDTSYNGDLDAFVVKLNPSGTDLAYATFLGGNYADSASDIAVDSSGNAYVTGGTDSPNFPAAGGPGYDTSYKGYRDTFVVKLNPAGTGLAYATFLGGSDSDYGHGIAVDASGNAYVTGDTGSPNFPAAGGPGYDTSYNGGYTDAFVVKLNPGGTGLAYATFLGGNYVDSANGIAVDSSGHAYVTGSTESSNFPTAGGPGYDASHNGDYDAFVVKLAVGGGPPLPTPTPDPTAPPPTPQPGRPRISRLRSCFAGPFYFFGPSLSNRYDAFVDWQGRTPAFVDFALNGTPAREPASGSPVSHAYDMGTDLRYGLLGARNELNVQAVATNGRTSLPYMLYPIGLFFPLWMPGQPAVINPGCVEGKATYKQELAFPEPPFEGNVTPPTWFPFIGGSPFGVHETQASLKVEASTDGIAAAELSGQTGFGAAGQAVIGRACGGGEGDIREGEGLRLTDVLFGLELLGKITAERPLLDVICKAFTGGICPLKEAENLPIVGSIVKWFNKRAELEAKFEPGVSAEAHFHTTPAGWRWKGIVGGARARVTLSLILDILKDMLSATAYGGGEPSIELQVPPDPPYLKQVAAQLFAGLKLTVWRFEQTYEASYEWSYAPGGGAALSATQPAGLHTLTVTNWHPIPRDYAADPHTYALFRANERPLHLAAGAGTLSTEENLIASNVFPFAHPAIAADGDVLLLWVHDDTGKPLMQGEEVRYSLYDGSSWSAPANITNDSLQDFAPQVAYDGSGHAVAVWERNKVVQSGSSALDAAYANAFELAYAVWNGTSWNAPAYLTNNNALDHNPLLAQGSDGQLLLVWRRNPAGELMGTPTHPDTLYCARWNGAAWNAPQVLLDGADGITGLSAARHDADTMAVAYSQDTDGDLSTSEDQELFLLTWNGAAWSAPARLTDDATPDDRPALFYDAAGNPRLLWLKGDTLYALLGGLNGTPRPIAVAGSAAVLDYAAAQDADDDLVLLWQGYSDQGVDAFYAAYDQAHDAFSLVEQLTHDEPLEKFLAPAFAPTGELLMAYGKDKLLTTTITLSPTLVISNVTVFGQSDLYVLRHTFGPDLALTASDLAVTPANPTPGSTARITATLHNDGDRAVVNPQVRFYRGDPHAGGTAIGTAAAPLTLAGGMTATLGVNWAVPSSGGPFALYTVADPDGAVVEWSESNNEAYVYAAVPDLAVADVQVGYGSGQNITLTARISNAGVVAASSVPLAFRLDDAETGTAVAQTTVGTIGAGAQAQAQAVWNAAAAATGWHRVYAVVDPADAIVEADETNNAGWAGAGLLPDLALYSTAVVTGTNADGSQTVSLWVFNQGQRAASGVTVGLYNRLPVSGTAPLTSAALSIPAGEHRVANLNLGGYRVGFYAGVDVNQQIEDRYLSNNVLRVGEMPRFVYLPLVLRNR